MANIISGKHLIAGNWCGDTSDGFVAIDAASNQPLRQRFADASPTEVELAIQQAHEAFLSFRVVSPQLRAKFLRTIGEQILALGDSLVDMACSETGLPQARIQGERGRTIGQLNLFANKLDAAEFQGIIEHADPNRQPLPKPDTRLGYLPLGVVGVFGASNFPLAFSTAGGDTASALAAGCPVVMKGHTAHPGTAELVAQAISKAIELCGIHPGVFSLIQGKNYAISSQIVTHPLVKAVGFTGSERVGMILQQHINQRPEPIPFYGELGSVNPQFVLPHKVEQDGAEIAQALVASLLMGQGQFCTSPGVWFVNTQDDSQYECFISNAKSAIEATQAGIMLTPDIAKSYQASIASWQHLPNVNEVAVGQLSEAHLCAAALFETDFENFIQHELLQQEVFGACAIVVRCQNDEQLLTAIDKLSGNLTASIHANEEDILLTQKLSVPLSYKVGRLIYNQMPTGVEVCASMNHGGPFPASTNIQSTSVGGEAIKRFQRPICYQNMPQSILPDLLKD